MRLKREITMNSIIHKITEERPWEAPWWKPSPGNRGAFIYIIGVHALAVVGLALHPVPSWRTLLVSLALAILGGLGTTVCYHRALSHRALKLHWIVKHTLIFLTILNGNGSPQSWVANHRHHHSKADTIDDV